MHSPLDDVAFLARSENRVAVLEELIDGATTRGDIGEATGVGRITLGRVLGDFLDRGWVVREGDSYELTLVGDLVAEAFGDVVEATSTARKLSDIVKWVPADEMDFDLRRLSTADVFVPTPNDPFAPLRRAQKALESTASLQLLTNASAEETLEAMAHRSSASELSMSAVIEAETLSAITSDSTTREYLWTITDACGEVYSHDGPVPFIIAVVDDVVHLGVDDETGVNVALIESGDPEVRAWAVNIIETYRREATCIEPSDIGQ